MYEYENLLNRKASVGGLGNFSTFMSRLLCACSNVTPKASKLLGVPVETDVI